jgi:hypothetical protein
MPVGQESVETDEIFMTGPLPGDRFHVDIDSISAAVEAIELQDWRSRNPRQGLA